VNAPPIRTLVFAVLASLSVATAAAAQDAAVANAEFTTVRFENDRVRVLETSLPPGAREPVHQHPAHLIYVLGGGRIRNHAGDGSTIEVEAPAGAVLFREATTHSTENVGEAPIRALLVELKEGSGDPGLGAEEAEVLLAVQRFFDAMAARDEAAARAVVDPEGDFVSVRWTDEGERVVRRSPVEGFLENLGAGREVYLERMWDAEVRIHGPIADVWAPYDFHLDGELLHCGVDAFQLLRTDGGWVITGGIYTAEQDACAESPLGSPNG